jgi:methionine aminopeptidase
MLDVTLYYDGKDHRIAITVLFIFSMPSGFHGDLNETYPVGKISHEKAKLIRTTRNSLDAAIKLCKPGALFRDLGKAMSVLLARTLCN